MYTNQELINLITKIKEKNDKEITALTQTINSVNEAIVAANNSINEHNAQLAESQAKIAEITESNNKLDEIINTKLTTE